MKRSLIRIFARLSVVSILALAISFAVRAQSTTEGAIGGTVTDQSGAVVPDAAVKIVNLGTNKESDGTTDGVGRYIVIHLQPGVYSVEITKSGFAVYKATTITVEVGRVTTVDSKLGVATMTETVVATAEAPVIVTDRPDFSTNINLTDVANLPMNGRRWSFLALSTPGATPDGGFGLVSFRGISGLLNNNTVDGADNNQAFFSEERGRTRISYSTSEASIQEFQVNTSNYSAEYGRAAGGVVNAVTKSGTNQIHGEVFWYDRNSDWGAINPFQKHLVNGVLTPFLPEDKRHQFGGSLGGWLVKDRVFWFFSADQQKRVFPAVANSGTPGAIFSPISVVAPATCPATPGTQEPNSAFTEGNVLFCRGITQAQTNGAVTLLTNLTGTVPRRGDQLVMLPKVDINITSNNHLSLSYNRFRWASPAGIQSAAVVNRGIESFGDDFVKDDWGIARLTSTISPTWNNELRYQYGRDFEFEFGQASISGEPVSSLGFSPQVSVGGVGNFTFGMPNFLNRPAFPDERRQQVADTMAWSHGTHLVKFGADFNHVHDNEINLFEGFGAYSYNSRVDYISDFVTGTATPTMKYCGTSSAPLPCYSSYAQGFGTPGFQLHTNDFAVFLQDDWRIRPRLTLNLGLRWDTEFISNPQIPNLPALPLTAKFPHDRRDFGPRTGFAWDIFGNSKTILRGGYGVYYGRIINSTIFNAISNTGVTAGQNTTTVTPTATSILYPNIITSGSAPPGLSVIQFQPGTRLPLVHEYDLEVERQIATNTVVSVSYVGSLGRRLPRFVDTNLAAPTMTSTYTVSGGPLNGQTFTVPFFGVPNTLTGTRRPNNAFQAITDISYGVNSNYNALIGSINRRFYKSFQVQSSFTWSRANDFGQSSQTFTATNNVLNPFNIGEEYSKSSFDVRDRFALAAVWSPDYYHGDMRAFRWIANGWTLAPIIEANSGTYFTPTIFGNVPNQFANGTICPSSSAAGCFVTVSGGTGVLGTGGTNRPPFFGPNSFQMPRAVDVDLRLERDFTIRERWKLALSADAFNLFNHVNVTGVNTQMFTISGLSLVFQPTFDTPTASSNTLTAQRQIQVGAKLTF